MVTLQPLEARILRDAQRDAVLRAQLLQLRQHAVRHEGDAFGVQAVHHRRDDVELVLHRVREEVCVDEDGVGGREGRVVLEEEGGGDLGAVFGFLC